MPVTEKNDTGVLLPLNEPKPGEAEKHAFICRLSQEVLHLRFLLEGPDN